MRTRTVIPSAPQENGLYSLEVPWPIFTSTSWAGLGPPSITHLCPCFTCQGVRSSSPAACVTPGLKAWEEGGAGL